MRECGRHSRQQAFGVALHTTQGLAFMVFSVENNPKKKTLGN
jgi:hypothetical protein